jgi:hypothetical protein
MTRQRAGLICARKSNSNGRCYRSCFWVCSFTYCHNLQESGNRKLETFIISFNPPTNFHHTVSIIRYSYILASKPHKKNFTRACFQFIPVSFSRNKLIIILIPALVMWRQRCFTAKDFSSCLTKHHILTAME